MRTDTYGEENSIRRNIHTEGRLTRLSRQRLELHGCKTRNVKDHGNSQKLREGMALLHLDFGLGTSRSVIEYLL